MIFAVSTGFSSFGAFKISCNTVPKSDTTSSTGTLTISPLRDTSAAGIGNVPGRIVPICGRYDGLTMSAMMLPPIAGRDQMMSPVFSSTESSVTSAVTPQTKSDAIRGAKSRP